MQECIVTPQTIYILLPNNDKIKTDQIEENKKAPVTWSSLKSFCTSTKMCFSAWDKPQKKQLLKSSALPWRWLIHCHKGYESWAELFFNPYQTLYCTFFLQLNLHLKLKGHFVCLFVSFSLCLKRLYDILRNLLSCHFFLRVWLMSLSYLYLK